MDNKVTTAGEESFDGIEVSFASNVKTKLPRIVAISGRTAESVDFFLNQVAENEINDQEYISKIQHLHSPINHSQNPVRGFKILQNPSQSMINASVETKRPIYYVFSGVGSQWTGMGRELMMSIEYFQRSFLKCAEALKQVDFDLIDLMVNSYEGMYADVVNHNVALTAIQISLVDLLTHMEIKPDGFLGHSVGDLACAYADGALTLEQTMLVAYWRATSLSDKTIIPVGLMAAVSLSHEEAQRRCPSDVYVACHNSKDSVTVCGPPESVEAFVAQLASERIKVTLIDSFGLASHAKYVTMVEDKMIARLEKIITKPSERSHKWISSTYPIKDDPIGRMNTATYHAKNLMLPVLFEEALQLVPDNAIIIEVSPYDLLRSVITSCRPKAIVIPLQKTDWHENNLEYFIQSIGQLYNAGANPKLEGLYPKNL